MSREKSVKEDSNRETVIRLQRWLRQVMATQSPPLTAQAWARQAGVSATNITRFLGHGYPVPKTSTLVSLAKAVGLPPPDQMLMAHEIRLIQVPVILGSIWR